MGLVVNADSVKQLIEAHPADWQDFVKKPSNVRMMQINTEAEVQTNEGVMQGHPGDWLAYDELSGHVWVISNDYKNMHYVPALLITH